MLGNGDATFPGQRRFAVGESPVGLAVANLNADGRLDLVTANLASADVSIQLGNGDGTFRTPRRFAVGLSPAAATAD